MVTRRPNTSRSSKLTPQAPRKNSIAPIGASAGSKRSSADAGLAESSRPAQQPKTVDEVAQLRREIEARHQQSLADLDRQAEALRKEKREEEERRARRVRAHEEQQRIERARWGAETPMPSIESILKLDAVNPWKRTRASLDYSSEEEEDSHKNREEFDQGRKCGLCRADSRRCFWHSEHSNCLRCTHKHKTCDRPRNLVPCYGAPSTVEAKEEKGTDGEEEDAEEENVVEEVLVKRGSSRKKKGAAARRGAHSQSAGSASLDDLCAALNRTAEALEQMVLTSREGFDAIHECMEVRIHNTWVLGEWVMRDELPGVIGGTQIRQPVGPESTQEARGRLILTDESLRAPAQMVRARKPALDDEQVKRERKVWRQQQGSEVRKEGSDADDEEKGAHGELASDTSMRSNA